MGTETRPTTPGGAWAARKIFSDQLALESRLAEDILAHTSAPVRVQADGGIHRFDHPDGRMGNKRLWYVCHHDFAVWGDWATGEQHSVFADISPAPETTTRAREEAERRKRGRQKKIERKRAHVAHQSQLEWPGLHPADHDHPYLVAKKVKSVGIRQRGEWLVVPLYHAEVGLASFQTIAPDGAKRFIPGGRKKDCYFPIGGLLPHQLLLICEGVATGLTLHEATGHAVACAMDCGNLLPVARSLRARHPNVAIIIAADNDRFTEGNPGVTAGQAAARAVGGKCIWPEFPDGAEGSDFNDLAAIGQEAGL